MRSPWVVRACDPLAQDRYHVTVIAAFRGQASLTVSLKVVLEAESAVRGEWRRSTRGLPGPWLMGELRGWGQAGGCVLQSSRALATATRWPGPRP